MACPKGWEALAPLAAADRATTPLLRDARGELEPVELGRRRSTTFVRALQGDPGASTARSRSRSSAPGRSPTEEMALLGALAKFGMGMVHGDGNTRQCMATSVVAYKQAFGFDAPPYTYADFEESDVIVLVGLEPVHRAPDHVGARLPQPAPARDRRRRSAQDRDGDGGDAAPAARARSPISRCFYGLAQPADRARAGSTASSSTRTPSGFDEFAAHVAAVHARARRRGDRARAASASSGSRDAIHEGKRVSFWWTMGVNQSHEGVRAGAGDHQPRADDRQHRPARHRRELDHRPVQRDGLAPVQQHDEPARRPRLRQRRAPRRRSPSILGIDAGAHPDASRAWPTTRSSRAILRRQDPRAVGHRAPTRRTRGSTSSDAREIARAARFPGRAGHVRDDRDGRSCADLVLPAAGWGEKEGTFINSERRIGLHQEGRARAGPGAGRLPHLPAGRRRLGLRRACSRAGAAPRRSSSSLKQLSRGQPCDITGIEDYAMLDRAGGIQWPLPEGGARPVAGRRGAAPPLFEDGRFFHADGKARLLFEDAAAAARADDAPTTRFALLTGRGSSSQWHTQTRTGKSAVLRKLCAARRLRRDQPGRRARPRHRHGRLTSAWSRGAASIARARLRDPRRAARAGVHADALRGGQPAHLRRVRSVLAPAVVQGLRRRRHPAAARDRRRPSRGRLVARARYRRARALRRNRQQQQQPQRAAQPGDRRRGRGPDAAAAALGRARRRCRPSRARPGRRRLRR